MSRRRVFFGKQKKSLDEHQKERIIKAKIYSNYSGSLLKESIKCRLIDYLRDGATKEFAALCRTLTPTRRIKAALSCSKTNFTVVPDKMR
jgi:hypothetical protein